MTFRWSNHDGASLAQYIQVRLGRRVSEHSTIHGRRQHQRARRRQGGHGQQVVRQAVRQPGQGVGSHWSDQQ